MPNQDDTQPDWMLDKDGLRRINESNRPNEQGLRFPNRYNGWANYETWCVNAHLTNEPNSYEQLMAIIQNPDTPYEQALALRYWVRFDEGEDSFDLDADKLVGLYADLLASALDNVEWPEIINTNSREDYR